MKRPPSTVDSSVTDPKDCETWDDQSDDGQTKILGFIGAGLNDLTLRFS
jgi:hypothetical protein